MLRLFSPRLPADRLRIFPSRLPIGVRLRIFPPAVADRRSASYISPRGCRSAFGFVYFPRGCRSAFGFVYFPPRLPIGVRLRIFPPAVADRRSASYISPRGCRSVRRACAHATGCAFGAVVVSEGCRRSVP